MSLKLLQILGSRGYSATYSYGSILFPQSENSSSGSVLALCWHWLQDRNLICLTNVPLLDDRKIAAVHVTEVGRRHLKQQNMPLVQGEIEILYDRLGHSLKPHYGQALLFAHLARSLGFVTALEVQLPQRRVMADMRLERGSELLWVSLESGLERRTHPLDRWHMLAQAQAYLPLVAADSELLDTAFRLAQKQIAQIRGAFLPELEVRLRCGARTLWSRRHNRFERGLREPSLLPQRSGLMAAVTCQALLRNGLERKKRRFVTKV